MQNMTILVADYEAEGMEEAWQTLNENGYHMFFAKDGSTAVKLFRENEIDMVIQELFLPDISGEQLCRWLRRESDIPVIILTAKDNPKYILEAAAWGADDYLIKPIEPPVLLAKIMFVQKRLRWMEEQAENRIEDRLGIFSIDLKRRIVKKNEIEIHLTPTEYKLLTVMAKSPNRVFTREQLITYALEDEFHGYDRSIDTYIKGLRKKIETDTRNPKYIRTVHGFGYKFVW